MNSTTKLSVSWLMLLCIAVAASGCGGGPKQQLFESPEKAVEAMAGLVGAGDERATERVFGPGSLELFRSGDDAMDREDAERVRDMIAEGVAFYEHDERTRVALLGEDEWPFPIPLVNDKGKWRFDTVLGREELVNRRVGRNELFTLTALHEIVDAQREYASVGRDGQPRAFAARFRSSEGRRDGLYWPPVEGEPLSPLGDLLADAQVAPEGPPRPFHGYQYRIIDRQGPAAFGGEMSYRDDRGLLTRGFAVVAWPEKYGNSGVMTFMISHRGLAWQKDLGPETASLAAAIDTFDPDPSWSLTPDELEAIAE